MSSDKYQDIESVKIYYKKIQIIHKFCKKNVT
jgi:hypothetical protein